MNIIVRFVFRNNCEWPVEVLREPWGDIFVVQPAESIEVVGTGPSDGCPELEIRENMLVIYGWVGSIVRVYKDGREIDGRS